MDDIYTNLENYDDFNKLEELKNENKTLKFKIEEYTSAINKLQKDFDMLAVEHKKLELNYSSLLKTAKAEIERKTLMIKELNMEKDKLIISARQNNVKNKFNNFQNDRFKNKNSKSSDTSSVQEQPQTLPSQVVLNEYKNNNSSPIDTTSTCSVDTRDLNDTLRFTNKTIKNDSTSFISKENSTQMSNKLTNKGTETKVKKIMNRRKSMPASSCRDVNYSTDDECESSITKKTSKTQHPVKDERKRSVDICYQKYKTYDSSIENNYAYYQEQMNSRNKSYYNDSNYRSRDSYDSSQRRRWNISPDRTYRKSRDYSDNHYQTYNRRGYDSPPRDKSYHQSRSNDHRCNYRRDRSKDYSRNNVSERYTEKHRLQDDLDEPSIKRQKYEHSHRYSEEERQRDTSASKPVLPVLSENSVSCQSPDYVHPDSHTEAPIREIRSTAVMHLEDPRLSSKKYKIINESDKEVLTTVNAKNIDIVPVNKKLWRFSPVPIPKALIEPPSSYIDNITKSFNMDYYASYNMYVDSNDISNKAIGGYYTRNEPAELSHSNKDVLNAATKNNETEKDNTKSNQATVHNEILPQTVEVKKDIIAASKHINTGYKIPIKNNSEVSTRTEDVSNNKISNQNSWRQSTETSQPMEVDSRLNDNIKSINNKNKPKGDNSTEKELMEKDAEKFVNNRNSELAMSRKIVESDLTLSDDTSDNFEPLLTIIDTQTKTKCKKYKTKERYKNHKSPIETKKSKHLSENHSDVIVDGKSKNQTEGEKVKNKEEHSDHSKKNRHKKSSPEGKDCVDDSKTSKIRKPRKEKETKPEIKTKFSELFGDSNSLITCDDLGVAARVPDDKTNFATIIEDTQDAVDIDIKEMEKLQAAKLQPDATKNESLEEKTDKEEDKKCDDLKISIRKTEDKYAIVHEETDSLLNKNTNTPVSNIPDTIIISTGVQKQNVYNDEFRQPLNVPCVEKVQHLSHGLALATSTPAKVQDSQKDAATIQSDCSSISSSDGITVNIQKNQILDTESQESDVPDVRIFVKRRRKVKK